MTLIRTRNGACWSTVVLAGLLTSAGCGTTSQGVTAPTSTKCSVSATASTTTFGPEGGTGQLTISTQRECRWTASAEVSWIALGSPREGQGGATIDFSVSRTEDPVSRTGVLRVAEHVVQIQQGAARCRFDLSMTQASVPSAGASRDIDVKTSSALCEWTARAEDAWIAIRAGGNGKGDGRVTFEAAPTAGPPREGRLVVAGQPVTVTQSDGCVYSISPAEASMPATAGTASVTVTTAANCPWSATSAASWVHVESGGAGSGPGRVQFAVDANSGPARSAAASIAGHPVRLTQASGCRYSISPAEAAFSSAGGPGAVAVSTATGCPWSAASHEGWVALRTPSGTGPASVFFDVQQSSYEPRDGRLTIAGQVFTVKQASGCTIDLSATSVSFGPEGGAGSFQVTTDCRWKTLVEGGAGWVVLTRGDSGNGSGPVTFTVAPNDGSSRSATLVIEDKYRFRIDQAGRR